MVKIDLITGFLGSGKTTFIKKYAKYLLDKGMNIGILENDFGAVNVDMLLLQDLMGDNCELEMISGGCDKETHRRRFRTKLIDRRNRSAECSNPRRCIQDARTHETCPKHRSNFVLLPRLAPRQHARCCQE